MLLIDTHAHIYLPEYAADLQNVMERADFVSKIFMPNIDLHTVSLMLEVHAMYPEKCFPTMGLHPCSVKEDYTNVLSQMEQQLFNNKITYFGIGESGLDYYWDIKFKKEQVFAFEKQLEWAKALHLPIIIHSRDALDNCIELIEKHQDGNLTGVFHCFSGTAEQLRRAAATGLYIGIGGVVTFKNGGLDKILQADHLPFFVLETDSPYLAPVPFRGKRNEPAYLKFVLSKLAEIIGLPENIVRESTTRNAYKLFGIADI